MHPPKIHCIVLVGQSFTKRRDSSIIQLGGGIFLKNADKIPFREFDRRALNHQISVHYPLRGVYIFFRAINQRRSNARIQAIRTRFVPFFFF